MHRIKNFASSKNTTACQQSITSQSLFHLSEREQAERAKAFLNECSQSNAGIDIFDLDNFPQYNLKTNLSMVQTSDSFSFSPSHICNSASKLQIKKEEKSPIKMKEIKSRVYSSCILEREKRKQKIITLGQNKISKVYLSVVSLEGKTYFSSQNNVSLSSHNSNKLSKRIHPHHGQATNNRPQTLRQREKQICSAKKRSYEEQTKVYKQKNLQNFASRENIYLINKNKRCFHYLKKVYNKINFREPSEMRSRLPIKIISLI